MSEFNERIEYTLYYKAVKRMYNYIVETEDGCWGWIGPKNRQGYGIVNVGYSGHKKTFTTSRLFYEINDGQAVKSDDVILHRCNNKTCLNPDHLKKTKRYAPRPLSLKPL